MRTQILLTGDSSLEITSEMLRQLGIHHAQSRSMDNKNEDHSTLQRPPSFEDGQDIRDRAFEFACRVVMLCNELVAIVTTIIKNKRRNVAANKRKLLEEKIARREAKRKPAKRSHEFQIPNS
jgi:hypothetical protein